MLKSDGLVQKVNDLDWSSSCVLSICLVNDFQCHSRFPNRMCAVMSQEWCVGYAFKTNWKSTDVPFSLMYEVLTRVIMYKMLEGRWVLNYLQLAMYKEWSLLNYWVIVGKFAGWLMYFRALSTCVSMFQNSTGGSSMTSLILQDHTFQVAQFSMCRKCPLCSFWRILYPGVHLSSHLPGVFVFKINSVAYVEGWWFPVHSLRAVLKWFLSNVFLAVAKASWWASRLSSPESGSPKNHCMGSRSWCRGKLGSLP